MFWSSWSFWLYVAAWVAYTGCLITYGIRSPWQRHTVGRGLFALYASLTAVLTLVLLAQTGLVPEWLRAGLRAVTMGGVAVAGFVQLRNILRLQRCDRHDAMASEPDALQSRPERR